MPTLEPDEISRALSDLDGWTQDGQSIIRDLQFRDFPEAIGFVVRLAFAAEAANHHPDLDVRYNKVKVALSTHSEGGITDKDIALARDVDQLAAH